MSVKWKDDVFSRETLTTIDSVRYRPLKVNILDLLFGEAIFSVCDGCSLPEFSLELLSILEPDVERARLERSDCAMMSSNRTSNCGEEV
jgi:hypothetical protein